MPFVPFVDNAVLQNDSDSILAIERCVVKRHMIFHEGTDEVVAVIVAWLAAQCQRLTGRYAGGFERVRQ